MSKLEFIVAYWLIGRIVRQGPHRRKITDLLMLLRVRFAEEFTEDNQSTRLEFLGECVSNALAPSEIA